RLAGAAAMAPPSAPAQRPCAEGFSRVLLSVDQFRVVSADLTHGAVSGGVCTVVACALLGVLLFAELGASLRVSYSTNVVIDDELDESLRIEYDTSVFDLPCKYREVGSWDKCGKDRFVTNKCFTHSTLDHWGGTAGAKYTEAEIAVLEQADVASDIAEDEATELDSDWSASSDHFQHKDFQAAATFHDYTLVNFYAEWRSHCRQFLPTWIEASDKIGEKMHVSDGDGRQSTVKFLKTNCVDFQDNCKKAKIAAFPTLRFYKRHGSFEVVQQHRSVTNIVSFLTSSIRNSHLIVARHHMMFNEGCRVAGQIHVPRAQGSLHLQAEPFGKMDLNPAITNVSHQACDCYCSGSCTTDCVQPAGTVALACECMSYPDSGEHNMFSVTPWSAAGYVKEAALLHTRDPAEIPSKECGADYLCELTGVFLTDGKVQLRLKVGAKDVVPSAPATDDSHTIVMSANQDTYRTDMNLVSCATCTANGLAPKVKAAVVDAFGIPRGFVTTIHATTASQPTVDGASQKDCSGGSAEVEEGGGEVEEEVADEIKDPETELKLESASHGAEHLAYQMKHGAIHGRYDGTVDVDGDCLAIKGKQVALSHTRDPAEIPFKKYGADYVCEFISMFLTDGKIQLHLKVGAKDVRSSARAADNSHNMEMGANKDTYKTNRNCVSCATCTINALAPKPTVDGASKKDCRGGRAEVEEVSEGVEEELADEETRIATKDAETELKLKNTSLDAEYLAFQMKHGSIHGRYDGTAEVDGDSLVIDGKQVALSHTRGPAEIPFKKYGADYVCESFGVFLTDRKIQLHPKADANKVVFSALDTDDSHTVVEGANQDAYKTDMNDVFRDSKAGIMLDPTFVNPVEDECEEEVAAEVREGTDAQAVEEAGRHAPGGSSARIGAQLDAAWWDTVDVPNSLGHKVATTRRVPAGLQGAWAEAMGKVLRESVGGQTAQDRERAWKFVIFAPRLIFAATGARGGRGANGKRAKHIKNDIAERLHAFWRGEWQELWEAAHRRELRVGAATAVDVTSRVRRVNTLLEDGQVAGAVATLRRSGQTAAGPGVHDRLRALFPEADTWDAAQDDATATPLAAETRQQLGDAIAAAFRKAKGGRAPGLDSSRNEHWRVLAADTEAVDALVEAALAWVEGSSPPVVDEWLRTGAITALHKASGGVRPLTVLAPFRRIVLTGFVAHTKAATRAAAGSYQYGLGVPGGADVQFMALQAAVHDRPGSVLVAVDVSNAFGTLARQGVIASLRGALPEYGSLLARLYARPAVGLWRDGTGDTRELRTGAGVPQGCPLSPAAFAAALHQLALQHFSARLQWLVTAYLDDVVAVVPSAEAEEYLRQLSGLLGPGGLVLDPSKTKVWLPPGTAHCPPSLRQYVKDELQVVGCSLTRRQDDDWDALAAGAGGGVRAMGAAAETLRAFGQTLREARAAGLGPQEATAMLRWTAQGLPNHLLRAHLQDLVAVRAYDTVLRGLWNDVLGVDMSDREWVQSCLPLRDGGLAAGAAEPRREAAHIAAWLDAAPRVAAALGAPSAEALLAARAAGAQGFEAAVVTYNASVGAAHCLQTSLAQGERHRQKDLVGPRMEVIAGVAKAGLDRRERGRLLSAGGPGAGAFTMLPTKPEHRMAPELYRISLRRRLLMAGARLLRGLEPQTHCRNTSQGGVLCGAVLDTDQHHALACETGGRRVARHDRIRDLLARWLARRVPAWVQKEQTVPQWQRTRRAVVDGVETARVETAVLDVVWARQGCTRAVDVVDVSPDSTDEREARARAAKAGLAAEDAARDKARRYPPGPTTPLLIPFAIETGGRVGSSARQLILDHLDRSDGEAGASADAVAFWQELSAVLQAAVAEQLLSAHKPPVVGGGR
ncbi:unnamed protein product, partial [Prorocentrum cordatum]